MWLKARDSDVCIQKSYASAAASVPKYAKSIEAVVSSAQEYCTIYWPRLGQNVGQRKEQEVESKMATL